MGAVLSRFLPQVRPSAWRGHQPGTFPHQAGSQEPVRGPEEAAIRLRNYSTRTLEAYRFWLAKFQAFVRSRPTRELGGQEVRGFLSDLAAGYAGVFLPRQLEKKYKNVGREFIWQWFFPARTLTWIAQTRERRRYHLHDSHVQGAVKQAAARAGIPKRVSPHTFRHTYASHLLIANYDLQTIQRLLGHSDIKTTMIYLQTVPSVTLKDAKSPLDCL
jgi:site-specific recombinase XerD